jgi:hypothetical protein
MCSVSASRPAFFNRPDSRVVFSWESLQEVVKHQREYALSSFDWVQTSSGMQWKSSLPDTERRRRFTAKGIAGLCVIVGRDAAYLLAYRKRFEFSECGLAEAIATANRIRLERVANHREAAYKPRVRAAPKKMLKLASKMLKIVLQCDVCGECFVRLRPKQKTCSKQCSIERGLRFTRKYQKMLKVERPEIVREQRKRYRELMKSCPKRRLRGTLSQYLRNYLRKRGTAKSGAIMKYIGCSLGHLVVHLESLFEPGMSWRNRDQWHVDHIYPLRAADPTDEFQLHGVCNWRNLRPMWATDNQSKQGSVTPETTMAFVELCKLVASEKNSGKAGKIRGRGNLRPRAAS